ncbi:MAG: DUF4364 family protein [Ruminococcaceae bacterium]|nr:DUF4364 family protein [Oscillospiraceae bacterium]
MQAPLKEKNDIKIFILYLLKNLKYPLDFNTISDIVVQDEFVNYFDFAECFAELLDAQTIEQLRVGDEIQIEPTIGSNGRPEKKTELYRITDRGIEVVEQLSSSLLNMIKEKSLKSAMRLLSFRSRGSEIRCSSGEREDGRYDLHCEIIENRQTLMELNMVVDTQMQLDRMMYNFNERPEVIYRGVISLLTGDINYLID